MKTISAIFFVLMSVGFSLQERVVNLESDAFTGSRTPVIFSINPAIGLDTGGTTALISGSNFLGAATVTFGGIAASKVTFLDSAHLLVITPAHADGIVDIAVTNPNGHSGSLASAFTYVPVPLPPPVAPCGPPLYCARTDRLLQPETLGTAPAINVVINEPDFLVNGVGARMIRVTNGQTTVPCGLPANRSNGTASSSEQNSWNSDDTLFVMEDYGGGRVLAFNFDPINMSSSFINVSGSCWLPLAASPTWSYSNRNFIYGVSSLTSDTIKKIDAGQGTLTTIKDLSTCGCGFSQGTAIGDISVNISDTRFLAYLGGQDNARYIAIWDTGLGCRCYNTNTGVVSGDWGTTGTVSTSERYLMHNARLSKDGAFVRITGTGAIPEAYWNVATLNVQTCRPSPQQPWCGGHQIGGFSHFVSLPNETDSMNIYDILMSDLTARSQLVLPLLLPKEQSLDGHPSWNNDNSSDSIPFCMATFQGGGNPLTVNRAWDREVVCVRTDGVESKVWRFAHDRASGALNQNAAAESSFQAIPRLNVSQDGKFAMFTSDWEWTLGTQQGSSGCPTSGTCRTDGFIVELK